MRSSRVQKRTITEVIGKQDKRPIVSVKKSANGEKASESVKMPRLEPRIQQQIPPAKIKLQLFPINQETRLGLEEDGFNPFLELSLSLRKKISSVIMHLNTKWGSSGVARGQLMLFPFNAQLEQLASCKRWTLNDGTITTGDVYAAVESPSLFRLRYGWSSAIQPEMVDILLTNRILEPLKDSRGKSIGLSEVIEATNPEEEKNSEANEDIPLELDRHEPKTLDAHTDHMDDNVNTDVAVRSTVPWDDSLTNLSIGGLLSEISKFSGSDLNSANKSSLRENGLISEVSIGGLLSEISKFSGSDLNSANKSSLRENGLISEVSIGGLLSEASLLRNIRDNDSKSHNKSTLQPIFLTASDISIGGLLSEASLLSSKGKLGTQAVEKDQAQLPSPWDDRLFTLSIGGLLSEASLQANLGCNSESKEKKRSLQPSTTFSDSFDAFVAAQLNAHSQVPKQTVHEQCFSLLDAEETCHAFPVRKLQQSSREVMTSDAGASSNWCSNSTNSTTFQFPSISNTNNEPLVVKRTSRQQLKMNPLPRSL